MSKITLVNEECLKALKDMEANSVDLVLVDLPYGTTACKWDSLIDLDLLWEEYYRVGKEDCAFVMFAAQPFTTTLAASNLKDLKYSMVYQKTYATGFQMARKRPMKDHEDILVFYRKQPTYNPQMVSSDIPCPGAHVGGAEIYGDQGGDYKKAVSARSGAMDRYPRTVLGPYSQSKRDLPKGFGYKCHPTQKQLALLEWLVKTYSNEGDLVLDNTMGSGSTGVACKLNNRDFVGIEQDTAYFQMANDWLNTLSHP